MTNLLVYGPLTLLAPFRNHSEAILASFMNITLFSILSQFIVSYIFFALMFIGNVISKSTRSSDWFLLLYFFINGIGSRAFQNVWY